MNKLPWERKENQVRERMPFCKIACCYIEAISTGNGYCDHCYKEIIRSRFGKII